MLYLKTITVFNSTATAKTEYNLMLHFTKQSNAFSRINVKIEKSGTSTSVLMCVLKDIVAA